MHKTLMIVLFSVVSGWGGFTATAFANLPSTHNCQNTNDKMRCLVCNCFHEARGESFEGQVAVSRVVLSRAMSSSYPDSVCGVVYQRSQFSWTASNSKKNMTLGTGSRNEPNAYRNCVNSVNEALKHEGVWYGSHFHTVSVRPSWVSTCSGRKQIGRHVFYTRCGSVVVPRTSNKSNATGAN